MRVRYNQTTTETRLCAGMDYSKESSSRIDHWSEEVVHIHMGNENKRWHNVHRELYIYIYIYKVITNPESW
jgi:hypothetical protein